MQKVLLTCMPSEPMEVNNANLIRLLALFSSEGGFIWENYPDCEKAFDDLEKFVDAAVLGDHKLVRDIEDFVHSYVSCYIDRFIDYLCSRDYISLKLK